MRRFAPAALAVSLLLLASGAALWYWRSAGGAELPVISRVPAFAFQSEERREFTRNDLEGKVTIADFIFTSCAGTCPMMSTGMRSLQDELARDPMVQLLSISVDPETDTPEALEAYARAYGAIRGKWIFLTGDKKKIFALTREGFHLGLDTEGEDAVIHSQKFVLVDRSADIRGYYDSDDPEAMRRLVADARRLAEGAGL